MSGCKPIDETPTDGGNESLTDLNVSGDETNLCEYNKEYESSNDCICDGMWASYTNFEWVCVDEEIKAVCRKIENRTITRELLVTFKEGTLLSDAKNMIHNYGYSILRYDCDFSSIGGSLIVIDIGNSDVDYAITELENEYLVLFVEKHKIISVN